jgi:hypothetical protein
MRIFVHRGVCVAEAWTHCWEASIALESEGAILAEHIACSTDPLVCDRYLVVGHNQNAVSSSPASLGYICLAPRELMGFECY